jgi:hypothetical protein
MTMRAQRRARSLLEFERRHEPVAPVAHFRRRLVASGFIAGGVIAFSLGIGVLGYRYVAGIPRWIDCLHNASMILGGMGPVGELETDAGKLFASVYALYSGVALLTSVGVLLSPALHRLLHHFHVSGGEDPRP